MIQFATNHLVWIVCGCLLLWPAVIMGALLFLKRKEKPTKKQMPFVPLDGNHPELEAELELEKEERMTEMNVRNFNKYLNRF